MCENRIELLDLILGATWMGAVAVPLNTALRGEQLAHQLRNSGARVARDGHARSSRSSRTSRASTTLEQVWALDGVPGRPAGRLDRRPSAPCRRRAGRGRRRRPRRHRARSSTRRGRPARRRASAARTPSSTGGACSSARCSRSARTTSSTRACRSSTPTRSTRSCRRSSPAPPTSSARASPRRASGSRSPPPARRSPTCSGRWSTSSCRAREGPEDDARTRCARRSRRRRRPRCSTRFRERFGVQLVEGYGSTETNCCDRRELARAAPGLDGPRARRASRRASSTRSTRRCARRARRARAAQRPPVRVRDRLLRACRRRPSSPGATCGSTPATASCAMRTAGSRSWTASRTRSAAAARTSRRSRSSTRCSSTRRSASVAVFPVASELAEDEVAAAIVLREGAAADPVALIRHCEPRLAYFAIPRYLRLRRGAAADRERQGPQGRAARRGVTDDMWDREAAGVDAAAARAMTAIVGAHETPYARHPAEGTDTTGILAAAVAGALADAGIEHGDGRRARRRVVLARPRPRDRPGLAPRAARALAHGRRQRRRRAR